MFSILSVITSFAFVFFGVHIISGEAAPRWLMALAYVTAAYGLLNLAILTWARNTRAAGCLTASMAIAVCYFGVYAMNTLTSDMESGLEIVGVLLVGLLLWTNWFAVKKIVQPEKKQKKRPRR